MNGDPEEKEKQIHDQIERLRAEIKAFEIPGARNDIVKLQTHVAELQVMLAERSDLCVNRLAESSLRLERYTKRLVTLTIALVLLTVVLAVLTGLLVHFPEDSKADKGNSPASNANNAQRP